MANGTDIRQAGMVFNELAGEYHRNRPGYPDALIDRACELAAIEPGSAVLEIGCGTGQLTGMLLERGLRVTAIDPGDRMIARARDQLLDVGEVQFVNERLEDASLPDAHYRAVFSASAIHWVDPDVSWRKMADALVDGGSVALVSYFGLDEPPSAPDQRELRAALARVAPELAAEWPTYRDLDGTLAGIAARQANISEIWGWLGSHDLGRSYAGALYEEAQVATMPMLMEHTGAELTALLGTMSFWAQLSARQRAALADDHDALHRRLGRPIRSSILACVVTARRALRP